MRTGVFPGSFNPPTVAHLAVADEARVRCRLDRLDLVVSIDALGKHAEELAALEHRLAALRAMAAGRPWLDVRTTEARLLVDIAAGYQVVVMGADKWAQVVDPAWYGGTAGRDAALARLPEVAVAPRPPHALPPPRPGLVVLEVHVDHHEVSATAVRNGRAEWLAPGVGPETVASWGPAAGARRPVTTGGRRMTESEDGPQPLARARVHREALAEASDALDDAAARPAGDVQAWKDAVAAALDVLGDALDQHIAEVEGPDGLFTDVLDRSPRLSHQIDRLRAQHTSLRALAAAVGALLPAPADRAQVDEVREAVLALHTAIARHRHLGTDLIWDSYDLDIGGEGD